MTISPISESMASYKVSKVDENKNIDKEKEFPPESVSQTTDTVELSEAALKRLEEMKALSESEAKTAALAVKEELSRDENVSLGLDESRFEDKDV